jgi:hypothetical protein
MLPISFRRAGEWLPVIREELVVGEPNRGSLPLCRHLGTNPNLDADESMMARRTENGR